MMRSAIPFSSMLTQLLWRPAAADPFCCSPSGSRTRGVGAVARSGTLTWTVRRTPIGGRNRSATHVRRIADLRTVLVATIDLLAGATALLVGMIVLLVGMTVLLGRVMPGMVRGLGGSNASAVAS